MLNALTTLGGGLVRYLDFSKTQKSVSFAILVSFFVHTNTNTINALLFNLVCVTKNDLRLQRRGNNNRFIDEEEEGENGHEERRNRGGRMAPRRQEDLAGELNQEVGEQDEEQDESEEVPGNDNIEADQLPREEEADVQVRGGGEERVDGDRRNPRVRRERRRRFGIRVTHHFPIDFSGKENNFNVKYSFLIMTIIGYGGYLHLFSYITEKLVINIIVNLFFSIRNFLLI